MLRDIVEPDTVSLELMKAGDVESNPGPVVTRSRSKSCAEADHCTTPCREAEGNKSEEARHPATPRIAETIRTRKKGKNCKIIPVTTRLWRCTRRAEGHHCTSREEEGNPTEEAQHPKTKTKIKPNRKIKKNSNKCRGCKRGLSSVIKPITCEECAGKFHKSCTGETKYKVDKMQKFDRKWKCKFCKFGLSEEDDNKSEAYQVLPGMCMAVDCKDRRIRAGNDFLICSECKGQLHKKQECCRMSRQQVVNLDRTRWKCEGCQGIDSNPRQAPEDNSPEFRFKTKQYKENLIILQWNCDSISSKLEELKIFLKDNKVDVFMLQETKMIKKDSDIKIKDYTIIRRDRPKRVGKENCRGGGMITGIRDTIPYRQVRSEFASTEDEISEWITIEIPTKTEGRLRLTNAYIPPIRNTKSEGHRNRKAIITTDKWPAEVTDCIFGDLNAHSEIWSDNVAEGKIAENERGKMIEDWLASTNMICINDPHQPTRSNRNPTAETVIDSSPDQTFVHAAQIERFKWRAEDNLNSDHKPIIITYQNATIPKVNTSPQFIWKLSKADWPKFTEMIEERVQAIDTTQSVFKMEEALSKEIRKAANKHIGRKKMDSNTKPFMTKEIKEAIKRRNQLRKTSSGKEREELNQACQEVASLIREEREKAWREYVENIDLHTDPRKVWRTIRSIEGSQPPQKKNEVLVTDGIARVEDKDKAEAFARTYRKFSQIPKRKEDKNFHTEVRKKMTDTPMGIDKTEREISMREMETVINHTGNFKAAGEDEITYEMLKKLGPKAKELLLLIFNLVWKDPGGLPRNWRTAVIRPLLKEGKDPEKTASYRPISLTSCCGKILEKIVADRMTQILEERGLFTNNQAGFRQGRSTTDQVLKLTQNAIDQIHQKDEGSVTLVTFFDYEKAYDKVWRAGLLSKMQKLELPGRFVRYTRNFLSGRVTSTKVNNTRSRKFHLKEGLPQGSAISPLLFLVFINDIDVELSSDTLASLFADDTAIWTHGGEILDETGKQGETAKLMQKEVDKIIEWADTWKMSINTDKTKTMVISSDTSEMNSDPKLRTNKGEIAPVKQYKFLGVTLDQGQFFNAHLNNTREKCRKRTRIIKSMAGRDWGNSMEVQRTLWIQFGRPVIEYAASSFHGNLSETNIKSLEVIQNEALRSAAGLAKTCPHEFLWLETNIEPIRLRLQKNDEILWDKYRRLPETDDRFQLTEKNVPSRLKTRAGWRNKTIGRIRQHGLEDIPRDRTTPPLASWHDYENLTVKYTPLERKKEKYQPEELRKLAIDEIDKEDAYMKIYTDGSTDGRQENGGAGIFVEDRNGNVVEEMSEPAGSFCSSYGGECVAMLHSLRWIAKEEESWGEVTKVLICTDSRSLTEALDNRCWKDPDYWLKEIKKELLNIKSKITLLWIPSHVNIPGNDRADELADRGTKMNQEDIPITHSIIKARIKKRPWTTTHERAREIYHQRKCPRLDIEKEWPREARTLYARLRSGHSNELRSYRHFIKSEDDPMCEEGCGVEETIKHVLCDCVATSEARQRLWHEPIQMEMMVTHPNICRKILSSKFKQLHINEAAKTLHPTARSADCL